MIEKLTPVKSIRAKCLDCCVGQAKEVKLCKVENCPLYPYRMGKRPKTIGFTYKGIEKNGISKGGCK